MPSYTIRPDSSSAADFTSTPAGSAAWTILDQTTVGTASFIQRTSSNQTKFAVVGFENPAIGTAEQVLDVSLYAGLTTPKDGNMTVAVGFEQSTNLYRWGNEVQFLGARAVGSYQGPVATVAPGGKAWTLAQVNGLVARLTDAAKKSGQRGRFFNLYAVVRTATQGTATISAPTGTVTATSRPTVSWSWSEADGANQGFYEVRVYTAAQVATLGFSTQDTAGFPPVWSSGEVASTGTTARVGVSLPNGDYYVYVRAARNVANNPFWSAFDFEPFTMGMTLPDTPTVSATHSTTFGRVTVNAAVAALGTAFSSRTVEFQRLDGATWTVLDDGVAIGTAAGTASFVDYFAPRGGTVQYRARQTALLSDETIISSFGSASVNVVNDGTWWLKPVDTLGNSLGSVNVAPGYEVSFAEQATVYSPIGRAENVVVSAGLTGRSGSFDITTVGTAEWASVEAVLEEVGNVYVEAPDNEAWTVRFGGRSWQTVGLVSNPIRRVSVDWVEV